MTPLEPDELALLDELGPVTTMPDELALLDDVPELLDEETSPLELELDDDALDALEGPPLDEDGPVSPPLDDGPTKPPVDDEDALAACPPAPPTPPVSLYLPKS